MYKIGERVKSIWSDRTGTITGVVGGIDWNYLSLYYSVLWDDGYEGNVLESEIEGVCNEGED
jgi:hypothetical protein